MPLPMGGNKPEQMASNIIGNSNCGKCIGPCHHHFGKKILWTVLGILLVYVVFYVGTLIRNNMKNYDYIGKAPRMERMITVNGFGKVVGNNDIAQTTIGFFNIDKDIAKAQADNRKVMDQVYADLKKLGINEKDLQSNYSVFPEYNYPPNGVQELKGYRVNNSLNIKIRDLTKINEVLGLAGKYGANEINGLSFTIDDPENLKAQAKEKALADAKVKAKKLSDALGVRLIGIVSYYENDAMPVNYYGAPKYDMAMGMGGGVGPAATSGGSQDVSMNVSITYEIAPF